MGNCLDMENVLCDGRIDVSSTCPQHLPNFCLTKYDLAPGG